MSCRRGCQHRFFGPDDVVAVVRESGVPAGNALVFAVSTGGRLVGIARNDRRHGFQDLRVEELFDLAEELGARHLVVALTVDADAPVPEETEIHAASALARELSERGVSLADSIVISGHRWWSMRDLGEQFR